MLDLAPAKWIWFPSERTLACTFVLFRREVELAEAPREAVGWIVADSRYRLTVNGERVQWGPAPHDPRHAEADPVDLTPYLRPGRNCIGVEVVFFGHGDGTWPFGKPGLLMKLSIDGRQLVTDADWRCAVDRAHRPGQYARWFLRALQEEFDARQHPFGWDTPGFDDANWMAAQEFRNPANRSAFAGGYKDYVTEAWMLHPEESTLSERSVPMLREEWVPAIARFVNEITWHRDPRDWFEFRTPGSFTVGPTASLVDGPVTLPAGSSFVTYELKEEVVGWPAFTIDAPEGTVVELMIQESHDHATTPWLDSHIYQWSRFVCREGENRFETFDFEAGRWLQIHVRDHARPVMIRDVGIRRRIFPWPNRAEIEVGDSALQRLFDASVSTLNNSAQDTIVDGMGRERQQYAGDGSHQLHAIRYAFGETRLPARFLRTFAQGQLLDGVFSDSWPAVDRLQRLWQRNVDASGWGPLLDHSVGFVFDHYHHWMQTGDLAPALENWPRLVRFVEYLFELSHEGMWLLPVDGIGENAVWIDHEAFADQADKACAFNLYVLAMLRHAFLPLMEEIEESTWSPGDRWFAKIQEVLAAIPKWRGAVSEVGGRAKYETWAERLQESVVSRFWLPDRLLFVNQTPEGGPLRLRSDDRALATAVLYDLCPRGETDACVDALADRPAWMGQSYPANMVWNYWALAKAGRIQPVIDDLRTRWAPMRSVLEAKSLQEFWTTTPDTTNLMSHCPLAPLTALYQGVLGLWPTRPGFETMVVRPQLGDIEHLHLVAHTPKGPVTMTATPREVRVTVPAPAQVRLPSGEVDLVAGQTFGFGR